MTATVLAFPPPSRPILQPSTHARGARPYVYGGDVDDWHAPGVTVRSGASHTAVDGAWLVEAVLGRPQHHPAFWPGVPQAADRARAFAGRLVSADGNRPAQYQADGAAFLAERDYAALLDQMGIGKSVQALIAAEARLSMAVVPNTETPVVLILCPALAKRHWQREVKSWLGYDAVVLDGLTPEPLPQARYIIANYDILYGARRRDASGVLHSVEKLPGWGPSLQGRFLIGIVDEAHVLRGRNSRRGEMIRKVFWGVPVVWLLSGTIMPNYIRDLWAPVDIMTAGLWGSYWPWARKYTNAHQGKYGWVDTGQDNLEELSRRMGYFMLGRTMESVGLQLPEKRREIYRVDVEISAPTVHEAHDALSRQKAVAAALRATARAKRPAVIEQVVEALNARQKVIVYTYLREQAEMIGKALVAKEIKGAQVFCVHGEQTSDTRDAQATNFRQCEAPAAFVATIDSVGMAISLVGADLEVFADLVPEGWKLLQAEKRGHRRGTTKRVIVRYLIATGTVDEHLAAAVIAKLATLEEALGKDSDAGDLGALLGGDQKSTQQIVDGLFEKLKGMSK